jgi:hypothetical protein
MARYHTRGTPEMAIIDKRGKIRHFNILGVLIPALQKNSLILF